MHDVNVITGRKMVQQLKLHSLKIFQRLDLNEKMLMTEIFWGEGVLFIKLNLFGR